MTNPPSNPFRSEPTASQDSAPGFQAPDGENSLAPATGIPMPSIPVDPVADPYAPPQPAAGASAQPPNASTGSYFPGVGADPHAAGGVFPGASQQQYPAYPNAMPVAVASAKTTTACGVIGLILGLIALLISWIPFLNLLSIPLALVGGVLGVVGIYATRPAGLKTGRAVSIIGTVMSIVSLLIAFITVPYYFRVLENIEKQPRHSISREQTSTPEAPEHNSDTRRNEPSPGNPSGATSNVTDADIRDGEYHVKIVSVQRSVPDLDGKPTVAVKLEVTNKNDPQPPVMPFILDVSQKDLLDFAFYLDEAPEGYEIGSTLQTVQLGQTITIVEGYVLEDLDAPVIVSIRGFGDREPALHAEYSLK